MLTQARPGWLPCTPASQWGPGLQETSKTKKQGVPRTPDHPHYTATALLSTLPFCALGRSSEMPSASAWTPCQLGLLAMGSPHFPNSESPQMKDCKRR